MIRKKFNSAAEKKQTGKLSLNYRDILNTAALLQ
jgi:hypothetical protein